MQVSENRPQNGVFSENSRLIVSAWKDENGGFRMRWCHTCYRISIVLVFLCEEGRMIRICHMSRKNAENLCF